MTLRISARFALLAILLAAFAFRLYRLGASSLWYDETVSLYLARLDLVSLTRHTAGDIHPPLYYYLLHLWGQLAGFSEFAAAFLSLFCGVLLIALVYRVARDLTSLPRFAPPLPSPEHPDRSEGSGEGSRGWGVRGEVAAFLVAISPFNLWYSQEVRMYTLGAVLGLASVWLFVKMLRANEVASSRSQVSSFKFSRDFFAYVIISAAGLYTLYYFVFLLVFENLCALVWLIRKSKIENRQLRNTQYPIRTWLSSQLAILILYLPWLPTAFRQATDPPVPPWRAFIPLPNALLETFSALALGQSVDAREAWWVLMIVAAVLVAGLMPQVSRLSQHLRPATWNLGLFLLAYTFIPFAFIYALSLWKPLYHVRYMFVYSPAFYILLALGITRITNYQLPITNFFSRLTQYALLITLSLASLSSAFNFWFDPRYADDDLRGAVHYLAERWRPGDAILLDAGYTYPALLYYFDQPIAWRGRITNYHLPITRDSAVVLQTGSIGGAASLGWGDPESDFYATTADETRAALDRVFALHPRVWMLRLYDTVVDPEGVIRDYLAQRGRIIDDQVFSGEANARVQGYLTSRAARANLPPAAIRREVVLGNRIILRGFEAGADVARAGAPFDFVLYWQARAATSVDARLYIGLFAEDGRVVASSEETPVGNALGTSRWSSGEIFRESARLFIPANVPAGNYSVRVALFDPFTREPLLADAGEWVVEKSQIRLMTVRIEK